MLVHLMTYTDDESEELYVDNKLMLEDKWLRADMVLKVLAEHFSALPIEFKHTVTEKYNPMLDFLVHEDADIFQDLYNS